MRALLRRRRSAGGAFLPGIDAFASLPLVKASSFPNRTVSSSQLAGISSASSPLQYNVLTINNGAGLNVNNSTYSAIFFRCNILKFVGSTGFFNVNGGDGASVFGCGCPPNGGNGASGGGGGAGPFCPGPCPGSPGTGGVGNNGGNGDFGSGGLGLGHLYSGSYAFLNGGVGGGSCNGPGFGGGGSAAPSELACNCGSPTYSASGGGGAGAGMVYGQANIIIGAGRLLANGGGAGLNYTGNLFSDGGAGGVIDIASVHKQAGALTAQVLGGSGSGDGSTRIRQINANGTTTAQTFSGVW